MKSKFDDIRDRFDELPDDLQNKAIDLINEIHGKLSEKGFIAGTTTHMSHDQFCRELLGYVHNMKQFLLLALRDYPELLALLDLDKIDLDSESFIDSKLHKLLADIICKVGCKDGEDLNVAVLIEHKSSLAKDVLFKILYYMLLYWKHSIDNETKFVPTIPIILYNGAKNPKIKEISDLIDDRFKGLFDEFVPKFKYILVDLNEIKDKDFVGTIDYNTGMLALKHSTTDLDEVFTDMISLIQSYVSDHGLSDYLRDFLYSLIVYAAASSKITKKQISDLVDSVGDTKLRSDAMTLLAQERDEGIKEGRDEGIKEGRKEMAIKMAKMMKQCGEDPAKISLFTGLTPDDIDKL